MSGIEFYTSDLENKWNSFVQSSKNGTFLFSRSYMNYHKHRYKDRSIVLTENSELKLLLPLNEISDSSLCSHTGLTYGGFVIHPDSYTKVVLRHIADCLKFLQENGYDELLLKKIPEFYCRNTSDEIDYALFLTDAILYRVDIASVVNNNSQIKPQMQKRRARSIKKAKSNKIEIIESNDFGPFWDKVLSPNLLERHNVNPVHNLKEIQALARDNPGKIRQFNAYDNGELCAGTTIFETDTTAHAQYISSSEKGRANGAIDLLFHVLIEEVFSHKEFFDFGTVNENEGRVVNVGLLDWKEGFGARAYAHKYYKIETRNFNNIYSALSD